MKYNVYGMKNGTRTLIKTELSEIDACNFIVKNERAYCYQGGGYLYLIAIPE